MTEAALSLRVGPTYRQIIGWAGRTVATLSGNVAFLRLVVPMFEQILSRHGGRPGFDSTHGRSKDLKPSLSDGPRDAKTGSIKPQS